ncbi:GDSL-like Lipase/Acylhydrolase [compost metagenome]
MNISFAGNLFQNKAKSLDKNTKLKELLVRDNAYVIYYSGANDLMWMIYNDPVTLKKSDENRLNYAISRANQDSVNTVIEKVEKNFVDILKINPNARIIVMSLYVPNNIEDEPTLKIFGDYISMYNKKLELLCQKYDNIFIDNSKLSNAYGNALDFHISEVGHKFLFNELVDVIYDDLIIKKTVKGDILIPKDVHETDLQLYINLLQKKYNLIPEDIVYYLRESEVKSEIQILEKVSGEF